MKLHDAGRSGGESPTGPFPDQLDLPEHWCNFVEACVGARSLRPVQAKALVEFRMLESRRNLVISAPTNSGKSMIGYVALAEALAAGKRALLLEPLRSLAQEKADDLCALMTGVGDQPGPRVLLSTGDYRLEHETFEDLPPEGGEVIVATPERLDAILRNPDNTGWIETVGCVVVDEAHLIGSRHRGPTLELVIANLLSGTCPPRVVLLSATVGEPRHLSDWLDPCDLIEEGHRTPALSMEVWGLDAGEEADELLCSDVSSSLEDDKNSVLVFVYRRADAEALATKLQDRLGVDVVSYHSGLSATEKRRVRYQFVEGDARVVVATTALALGVNLPATHVYIRDTTFFGHGPVKVEGLLQMAGRAGRGTREGRAVVLVRPGDKWSATELATALRTGDLPPLRSAFETLADRSWDDDSGIEESAQLVATCLSRAGVLGTTIDELCGLLECTLAGPSLSALATPSLVWLEDPARVLAFRGDDDRYRLTVLGKRGVRAVLPLSYVAGLGQLVRDLLSLDPEDKLISQWSTLDHLLVMNLLSDRHPSMRRFSEKLADQIDGWHESRPQSDKSLLFRKWVAGDASVSKVEELCGSLGLTGVRSDPLTARKRGYLAMLGSIVLDARSQGASVDDIERRWGLKNLTGVEESWRDVTLWLLAGQARLCELRCFYHHLAEQCEAGPERIRRVKRILQIHRHHCFDLIERLKFCSPLGPLVRGVRGMLEDSSAAAVGVGTIRKLEEAGITSLQDLSGMKVEDLVVLGVQRRFAKQIRNYIRRRLR